MVEAQVLGDHPAHRRAHDVRALDSQVVEQPDRVVREVTQRVGNRARPAHRQLDHRRRPALHRRRAPAVAVVVADHVEAAAGEVAAEVVTPGDHLRAEAHDQQHRRVGRVAERLVAEGDAAFELGELLAHPISFATLSASSGERPAFAATHVAAGAATRSEACAASPARSSSAENSSAVGGSTPSRAANSSIHSRAFMRAQFGSTVPV